MSNLSSTLNSRLPVGTVLVGYARWRPPLSLPFSSADQHVRHVVVQVLVGVAHVAAVENQRMIEQRAVAVLGLRQLVDKVRQHLHVILVDLRELRRFASDLRRDATRRGSPTSAPRSRDRSGR